MDRVTGPMQQNKRRRILWYAGLAVPLLVILWLFFASLFLMPRLRERNVPLPNPVEMVRNWLFPPDFIDVTLDATDVIILDEAPIDHCAVNEARHDE